MLQNINELYGNKLAAADGEIGHVKDFYFEDRTDKFVLIAHGSAAETSQAKEVLARTSPENRQHHQVS